MPLKINRNKIIAVKAFAERQKRQETTMRQGRHELQFVMHTGNPVRAKPGGNRQRMKGFSERSRWNLTSQLFEERIAQHIVLTFPTEAIPVDAKDLNKKVRALIKYLESHCRSGYVIFEFRKRLSRPRIYVPHLHIVVLDRNLSFDMIRRKWKEILGVASIPVGPNFSARVSSDFYRYNLIHYVSKTEGKWTPPQYEDIRRYWRRFGQPFDAHSETRMPNSMAFHAMRLARLLVKARCRRFGKPVLKLGDGVRGFRAYNVSKEFDRYWDRYKALMITDETPTKE